MRSSLPLGWVLVLALTVSASADELADITAPNTTLQAAPTSATRNTSATVSFSSSEASSGFECRLDGGSYAACTSPVTYANLADGIHSLTVRAIDGAGNVDPSPAFSSWRVDRAAPNTTISSGPSGATDATTATFAFAATEAGGSFQCRLDASSVWVACGRTKSFSGLGRGIHTLAVRAIDVAANIDASPATRSWTIQ